MQVNFQADANEVIDEMGNTITGLTKQVAVLNSQLKAADRQVHALQEQIDGMRDNKDTQPEAPKKGRNSVQVVEGEVA